MSLYYLKHFFAVNPDIYIYILKYNGRRWRSCTCAEGQQPPPQGIQQQFHMNWSHFKPEFSSKPDEDVEAHLLRTND